MEKEGILRDYLECLYKYFCVLSDVCKLMKDSRVVLDQKELERENSRVIDDFILCADKIKNMKLKSPGL